MFFKKRFIKVSRFSNKTIFLFNLFFNFNFYKFEFIGFFGFLKIFINNSFYIKDKNFLKIFSFSKISFFSLIFNIIKYIIFVYKKKVILNGLGCKAILRFKYIYFYLLLSHPIVYKIPSDIKILLNSNEITVEGLNKQRVGEVCCLFKGFKKLDLYKGKGIKYFDEKIILKNFKKK